jgi:hypothetical protein
MLARRLARADFVRPGRPSATLAVPGLLGALGLNLLASDVVFLGHSVSSWNRRGGYLRRRAAIARCHALAHQTNFASG